jgi:hypothetical protein
MRKSSWMHMDPRSRPWAGTTIWKTGCFRCKSETGHFQLPKGGWRACRTRRADGVFCESAAGFSNDVGYQGEGYFNALVNMFEQAIKIARQLSAGDRDALIVRLDRVRTISRNLGYGVGDDMDSLLANNIGT